MQYAAGNRRLRVIDPRLEDSSEFPVCRASNTNILFRNQMRIPTAAEAVAPDIDMYNL